MKKALINIVSKLNRSYKPSDGYLGKRIIKPASVRYGYDRGTPIDRYYIDQFVGKHSKSISGKCLEIGDARYIKKFGTNVVAFDVLDIKKTRETTIVGDIRNLKKVIRSNSYDCIILTQVLGMIDDVQSASKEIFRILKPGGTLLITSSFIAPTLDGFSFWRLSENSLRFLFKKYFKEKSIMTYSFGNNLSSRAFWCGLAQEDLTSKELEYTDKRFPLIVAMYAKK